MHHRFVMARDRDTYAVPTDAKKKKKRFSEEQTNFKCMSKVSSLSGAIGYGWMKQYRTTGHCLVMTSYATSFVQSDEGVGLTK